MNALQEKIEKLDDSNRKAIEDFADFLLSRQQTVTKDGESEKYLNVDAVVGMFAEWPEGKSAVDLVHEANEAEVRKYDKYFE